MSHDEVSLMLLSLAILLGAARILGEIAQWIHQPSVVGELLAGILLGPTVLGWLAPDWQQTLFPSEGPVHVVFSGMTTLAITLFLLVAGMEVDLSSAWRQGTTALKIGFLGTVIPFGFGLIAAWSMPQWLGSEPHVDGLVFALFFATALSISALPVIAKTLMDLELYRSDLGMIIVSAAVLNDLVGWIVFALVLGMMGSAHASGSSILWTILLTLLFAGGMLTVGRVAIHRVLPYIQAYSHWPGGVLSFAFSLALLGASLTEWIGVHAIFGAFLVGVAIGDSSHLREQTRSTIDHFVSFIFAPLFFGSIGLQVDFVAHFNLQLVLIVLALACAGKLLGCWLGAAWAGMNRRDGYAVGFGMNARGAMEIILGLLALKAGVIGMPLFVALVVMAIVTSMMSGPLMQLVLNRRKPRGFASLLHSQRFIGSLAATSRTEAFRELSQAAVVGSNLDPDVVNAAVLAREEAMPTAIGHGVALPHARLEGLSGPILTVGLSDAGIAFDSPDGIPVHAIFLILSPFEDDGAQLEIMTGIATALRNPRALERLHRAKTLTELLVIFKSEGQTQHSTPPKPHMPEMKPNVTT